MWGEFQTRIFPALESNIFDRIIAQFRTTSSRRDKDEDDEGTMRGLQDLLLPAIQSVAVLVLDKGVLFRTEISTPHRTQAGLIDRNEWRDAFDGFADLSSFRMMRFSAGCQDDSRAAGAIQAKAL